MHLLSIGHWSQDVKFFFECPFSEIWVPHNFVDTWYTHSYIMTVVKKVVH